MSDEEKYGVSGQLPEYRRIALRILGRIREGEFGPEDKLPSINSLAIRYGVSRESVAAAYRFLIAQGAVASWQGKGYFVREEFLTGRKSVLVILDKLSPHQQTILDSFSQSVGDESNITILMHYQSVDRLKNILDAELGRHDWYLLFPHFPLDGEVQQGALAQIRRIPSSKLILIDRLIPGAPEDAGASYQSIEKDIPEIMASAVDDIRSFGKLRFMPLSVSLYGQLVGCTISDFCKSNGLTFEALQSLPDDIQVSKGDVFFLTGSRLDRRMVALVERIRACGLEIGRDVGIICYNDFPLNELILGGLSTLSADFKEMGRNAAAMVSSGKTARVRCSCRLIRRNTF